MGGLRPPSGLPAFRSAVFPSGRTRHSLHQVHAGVFEFLSDHPKAQEENPQVVPGAFLVVGPLGFGACALGVEGFCGDRKAKLNVRLDLARVGGSVEKAELNRSGPPNVVQVDRAVAGRIVVLGVRVCVAEPSLVQGRLGGGFGLFQPGDEGAVGALGVVRKPSFKGSGGLEDQFLLFVKDPRDVGDLAGGEGAHANVNVLAGAARGFRSGLAQGPYNRLQGVEVFPPKDRGHHLGARGAVGKAAVADRFPNPAVRCGDLPGIVAAAVVPNRTAGNAVDRAGRLFAANVGVLKFRPEGQALRRLNCRVVGHFFLHRFLTVFRSRAVVDRPRLQ